VNCRRLDALREHYGHPWWSRGLSLWAWGAASIVCLAALLGIFSNYPRSYRWMLLHPWLWLGGLAVWAAANAFMVLFPVVACFTPSRFAAWMARHSLLTLVLLGLVFFALQTVSLAHAVLTGRAVLSLP
jgi:hypothetical protein